MQNQNEDCGCAAKGVPQGLHDITCSVTQQAMREQGIDPTRAMEQLRAAIDEAGSVKKMMQPLREGMRRDIWGALHAPSGAISSAVQAAEQELAEEQEAKAKVPAYLKSELTDAFVETVEILGSEAAKQRKRADGFKALYESAGIELRYYQERTATPSKQELRFTREYEDLQQLIRSLRSQRAEAEQEADKYENDLEELKAERKKDHEMLLRVLGVLGGFHNGNIENCAQCTLVHDIKQLLQGDNDCSECAGQPEVDPT